MRKNADHEKLWIRVFSRDDGIKVAVAEIQLITSMTAFENRFSSQWRRRSLYLQPQISEIQIMKHLM